MANIDWVRAPDVSAVPEIQIENDQGFNVNKTPDRACCIPHRRNAAASSKVWEKIQLLAGGRSRLHGTMGNQRAPLPFPLERKWLMHRFEPWTGWLPSIEYRFNDVGCE